MDEAGHDEEHDGGIKNEPEKEEEHEDTNEDELEQ